jgi:hypothetical protein
VKRGFFLKLLPAIPAGLTAAAAVEPNRIHTINPIPVVPVNSPFAQMVQPSLHTSLLQTTLKDMIEYWSGGIRPTEARLVTLAKTRDVEKRMIMARYPEGKVFTKTILFSGLMASIQQEKGEVGGTSQEKAYMISKRAREIGYDFAYTKWGSDWRRHVPPHPTFSSPAERQRHREYQLAKDSFRNVRGSTLALSSPDPLV